MFARILNSIRSALAPHPNSIAGSRHCSFECYDEDGCPGCSVWTEWEDEDYGTIGTWIRLVDGDDCETLDDFLQARRDDADYFQRTLEPKFIDNYGEERSF